MKKIFKLIGLLGLIMTIPATLCAQAKDVSGWQSAVWGMQEADIVAAFGPKLIKLKKRAKFVSTYADHIIPDYEIDGHAYTVFFEMDRDTDKLSQVLVRSNEMRSKVPREDVFAALETMLRKTLGEPASRTDLRPSTRNGYSRIILNTKWQFPTTTIELAYDWSNYVNSSLLGIKYVQAASTK